MAELANYTNLINQTIETLNKKDNVSGGEKQRAIKFYFWLQEYLPESDQETHWKFREYETYLRRRKILL